MEPVLETRGATALAQAIPTLGQSAVSWPAIFAGAAVAVAASVILLALGTGLGFASISPWSGHGVSATTFAITSAIWLIVMQWVSSGVGGYVTGRLRVKWVGTHTHEVFFRDTAHGFITWSVATILAATAMGLSAYSAMNVAAHVVAGTPPAAALPTAPATAMAFSTYDIDKLFRSPSGAAPPNDAKLDADAKLEASRIFANAAASGALPQADRSYLGELASARAGISQADALQRVDEVTASVMAEEMKLKMQADAAAKAASATAIFTALSLLVGAFIASVAAALGGRLRDEHI